MLAVQRPRMGSSKPPNPDMPFGYSFDTSTSIHPFPSPTAPAPGPSLLDDNESKILDSFFDGVSSDHFNYDFFNNAPDGSELGLGWNELPPAFMGTTSSFGQQPVQISSHHSLPDPNFNEMNQHRMNAGPPIPPSTPADVLAAATLLQNRSNGRSHSTGNGALFRRQEASMQTVNGQVRPPSMSAHPSQSQSGFPNRFNGDNFMRDTYYADMVFGSGPDQTNRQRAANQKVDIRWGSDAGFNSPQGFIPPAGQDNIAASERSHIQAVENAFSLTLGHMPSSTDTTRTSSPVASRDTKSHQRTKSAGQKNEDEDPESRPRKRRKSKIPEEEDEDDDVPVSATLKDSKKRKSSRKSLADSPASESEQASKRRKSAAAAAAKASRENLTEEQKRENHIKSEQKRRTLIREGFEDLGELVPGLRGGGFSKSAVLIMAADWLEDLIQGNEVLRDRLDQMQGR